MEQIKLDWSKELIRDIYSIDAAMKCNDDDEPVIIQEWFGAEHLCVDAVDGVYSPGASCAV